MDLARRIYSRELKIAAMREIDSGRTIGEVARQLELSPHLLDRWRGEWRARGDLAFPGIGRRGVSPAFTELQRIAELEEIGLLISETGCDCGHQREGIPMVHRRPTIFPLRDADLGVDRH